METEIMGRVTTEATFENSEDHWAAHRGTLAPDQVRRIVVPDVLVDTGATGVALPTRLITTLGLLKFGERRARASSGTAIFNMYQAVQLTIMGRTMTIDVMEVPDDVPPLIGQVPLEMLDLVVDPQGRRLTTNPAHNGEHILEML